MISKDNIQKKQSRKRNWFAIHTYSGYEHAVARNLKHRIESFAVQDLIFNVIVPVEKVIKIKGGKRIEIEEKIYPGYVLVDMVVTEDSWYIIRNTPRVTGFVGAGGTEPIPVSKEEMESIFNRMNKENIERKFDFEIGESIIIIDGPFKEYEGKINSVDIEREKVEVLVSMFGRETPVELDFLQIKKL